MQGYIVQSSKNCHYLSVAIKNVVALWQRSVISSTAIIHAFPEFSENQTVILTGMTSKFIFTLLHSFS